MPWRATIGNMSRASLQTGNANTMQSSLRNGLLVVVGCLAAWSAAVLLPAHAIAAQSSGEKSNANSHLFQAVQANDLAAVQTSIGEGADVEARDRWGMTPTDIAVDRGHYRIAHFLVSVRNSRHAPDQHSTAAARPATTEPGIVPTTVRKPSSTAPSASPEKPDSPPLDGSESVAAWPAGEANPFDPTTPAPGSQLRALQRGR
ncbi:MAG: ankyrin repeat domain-containing protein [Bacteroidota bacterium]